VIRLRAWWRALVKWWTDPVGMDDPDRERDVLDEAIDDGRVW
jgi:hypothetical protein